MICLILQSCFKSIGRNVNLSLFFPLLKQDAKGNSNVKVQNVGYIRVSSIDQKTTRQFDGFELDTNFEDYCSGKDINWPQLKACH